MANLQLRLHLMLSLSHSLYLSLSVSGVLLLQCGQQHIEGTSLESRLYTQ